jgi:hypothetical protein
MATSLWSRLVNAYQGAKEGWRRTAQVGEPSWSDVKNRRQRYDFYWAYYDNNIYDTIRAHKARFALYRFTRPIDNPVKVLVGFWENEIWGGQLDYETKGGAIPIETNNEQLRIAVAQIWEWSNWQDKKTLATKYGSCLGDVALKVVDQAETEDHKAKVWIQVLHPRMIKNALFDARGNITYAEIEYTDAEPSETTEGAYTQFTYREVMTKKTVSYYKDNEPHDYYGWGATCDNPYGFVPLVLIQHGDVGMNWGECCFADGIPTIDELNSAMSIFNDRMMKANNPVWLMAGARASDIDLASDDATTTDQTPRQKLNALYGRWYVSEY